MDRKDYVRICKACDHSNLDFHRGLLCNLTDEFANFQNECPDFKGDPALINSPAPAGGEKSKKENRLVDALSTFLPGRGFLATPILGYLCLLIFALMVFSGVSMFQPDLESLIHWGASAKTLVLAGQYWRLLSSCFVHIGIIHLIFNLYALIYIGRQLEPVTGSLKLVLAFVITGIGGAALSFWWHDNVVSAGASGAIFGLFGVYIALLSTRIIQKKTRLKVLASLLVFVGFNLVYGIQAGIDNAAHIGGLLSGLLFGYSLLPSFYTPAKTWTNRGVNGFAVLWILVLTLLVLFRVPGELKSYSKLMAEFIESEEDALGFYRLDPGSSDALYLKVLREESIPAMEECGEIIQKIDALEELPLEIDEVFVYLKRYCDYRRDNFALIEKALVEKNGLYDARIQQYNMTIERLIRRLQGEQIPEEQLLVSPAVDKDLLSSRDMLYVLDGVPLDGMADIDPNIIEQISVLKKDVARSLYGSRGENGAIIISTRKIK